MARPQPDARSSGPKSAARLVAIGGQGPRECALTDDKTSVGSAPDNDIVIDAPTVSRYHAVIRRTLRGYAVADLESTNGTFVNGARIRNPAPLKRGDEVRFGAVRFAFMLRRGSIARRGRSIRPGLAVAMAIVLFAAGFVGVRIASRRVKAPVLEPVSTAAAPDSAATGKAPAAERTASPSSPAEPEWLALLNWYRKMCGLRPVTEDARLSSGDRAHVRYLLANYSDALRSGAVPGEEMHLEREGSPGYSSEGVVAGQQSDVDFVYWHGHKPDGLVNFAILDWISGAFHRLPLLNPNLRRVGYYDFCGAGICMAAMNAIGGKDPLNTGQLFASPVQFPPDRAEVDLRTFTNEWPDPLASCDGYAAPTGLPITLSLGSFAAARLGSFTVESTSRSGTSSKVEACGFDQDTYANPDASAQSAGREVLKVSSTVVVIPRRPLERGATYRVTITVNDRTYQWSFTVSG